MLEEERREVVLFIEVVDYLLCALRVSGPLSTMFR